MTDGADVLRRRVVAFEEHSLAGRPAAVDADVYRFLAVVQATVPGSDVPTTTAAVADAAVEQSALLARLADRVPELVVGPLATAAQFWVATGRPDHLPPREPVLDRDRLREPPPSGVPASSKPFEVGLYTSTGTLSPFGMWHAYLETNRGSTLFPPPWDVWRVEPRTGVTVVEVSSARDWVDLVTRHPVRAHGMLYPDWHALARDVDGVHMTVRAIAATQGLGFRSGPDVVAPPYWDVESTLWLRWCFAAVRLVATEP